MSIAAPMGCSSSIPAYWNSGLHRIYGRFRLVLSDHFTGPLHCDKSGAERFRTSRESGPGELQIENANTLFSTSNTAFSTLGGPQTGNFDFGLSFFYGKNMFTAIEGATTPIGSGPYYAFLNRIRPVERAFRPASGATSEPFFLAAGAILDARRLSFAYTGFTAGMARQVRVVRRFSAASPRPC